MTTARSNSKTETLANLARRAAEIAANSTLQSINLAKIEGGLIPVDDTPDEADLGLHMEHRASYEFIPENDEAPPVLVVTLSFDVAIRAEASHQPVFQVRVVFNASYALNRGMPDEAANSFDAFAQTNSVIHAWPYFRELVQSILWRSGLPPFPLPLFRITDQPVRTDPRSS